jgi:hypothetical protein
MFIIPPSLALTNVLLTSSGAYVHLIIRITVKLVFRIRGIRTFLGHPDSFFLFFWLFSGLSLGSSLFLMFCLLFFSLVVFLHVYYSPFFGLLTNVLLTSSGAYVHLIIRITVKLVFRIRIRGIRTFLGHPDSLFGGPDPDPPIIKQKE